MAIGGAALPARDWVSVSRPHPPALAAPSDAPLIGERAATRGRSSMEGERRDRERTLDSTFGHLRRPSTMRRSSANAPRGAGAAQRKVAMRRAGVKGVLPVHALAFGMSFRGCVDHSRRYDGRMQSIEIDPELSRLALAEAAQQYPEFAGHALRVIARPLLKGFAWQVEWKIAPPAGQQAWEFQNTAIRAYKRLSKIIE
jgi:hypothetical protein